MNYKLYILYRTPLVAQDVASSPSSYHHLDMLYTILSCYIVVSLSIHHDS